MNRSRSVFFGFVIVILILAVSGCNLPSRSRVGIEITTPTEGQFVVLGQEVRIISIAKSTKGIKGVELFIDGELLSTDSPPSGTPKEYTSDQPWIPTQEGNVVISVAAKDANNNASEPISILVQVVQSISEVAETPTPTVTVTPEGLPQTQTAQVGCTDSANFVQDVTIPANSTLSAGSNFTKIWRINNNGTCDWVAYELIFASGDQMGGSSPHALPLVSKGSNADISLDLVAPVSPGTYTASWRIRASNGTIFGPELHVTIVVPQPPTNTVQPTVTTAPTLTPTATTAPLSVQQYSETVSIPGGGTGNTTVTCPAGSVVVSGGFATSVDVRVWHQTKDGNGWRVYATNTNTANRQIEIYAHCLHNSGGTTTDVLEHVYVNANTFTNIVATCPAGSVVTGGAWVIGTDEDIQLYNSSPSGNGWQIFINNFGSSTPLINVYAICLSGVAGTTSSEMNGSGVIPPGDYEILTEECPSGTYVTGGGFIINLGSVLYNTSMTGNSWKNSVRNDTPVQKVVKTYALCYAP